MVRSMTGFGREESLFEGKKIAIDLKSLNSKIFDLTLKIPLRYKEKEYEIRKKLSDFILRGKVDCQISVEDEISNEMKINRLTVVSYISQLKEISPDASDYEYLKMAIKMPEAVSAQPAELSEKEWDFLLHLIEKTAEKFMNFRKTEGAILQKELLQNIQNIRKNLEKVLPFEKERMVVIKERYSSVLKEFENVDETRFYQEMAYLTEKLDISEEKVRLAQHLKYFSEVAEKEDFNGKKLGFISQEIGREINTLGSKANHSEIQKLVVMMKDDLEKIKEQSLNIL